MMRAREAADPNLLLLGVTVLTSLGDGEVERDLGIRRSARDQVLFLAENALEAGLDGLVASPGDAETLREAFGREFLLVTPGIRLSGDPVDDQKRVATPAEAIANGADILVVGRSIRNARDPVAVARGVVKDISAALKGRV